jgi:hypothetical protein
MQEFPILIPHFVLYDVLDAVENIKGSSVSGDSGRTRDVSEVLQESLLVAAG